MDQKRSKEGDVLTVRVAGNEAPLKARSKACPQKRRLSLPRVLGDNFVRDACVLVHGCEH